MIVAGLIEILEEMDKNKIIVTQVVAEDGSTWNCYLDINDIPNSDLVQLRVYHPQLKTLTQSQLT